MLHLYHSWFPWMPMWAITLGVATGVILNFLAALWFGGLMVRKGRSRLLGIVLVVTLGVIGMMIAVLYPAADVSHRLRRRGPANYDAGIGKGLQLQQDGSLTEIAASQVCPYCNSRVPLDSSICRVCHQTLPPLPASR